MKPVLALSLAAMLVAPTAALAQEAKINLVNNSSHNILYIYLSDPDAEDWGDDLLGEGMLFPAGQTGDVTIGDTAGTCVYDMQFIFDTKQAVEQLAIDVCAGSTVTLTDD